MLIYKITKYLWGEKMEEKKKRKYDTVPEIYMNGSDSNHFFQPDYPFDGSECTKNAVPDDGNQSDDFLYGDLRTEHKL